MRRILLPLSAKLTATAQAAEVLPTPPLPVKNRYFVILILLKSNGPYVVFTTLTTPLGFTAATALLLWLVNFNLYTEPI